MSVAKMLGLTGSGLSADDHDLGLTVLGQEPVVGRCSQCKQVGWQGPNDLPIILVHIIQTINVEHPQRVDSHQDGTDVGVDVLVVVPKA